VDQVCDRTVVSLFRRIAVYRFADGYRKGHTVLTPGKSDVDHMLLPLDFQWRFAQPRWHSSIHSRLAPDVPASLMISAGIFAHPC